MKYSRWTGAILPAVLLSITAATAGEPDVPRRLGPQVVEAPGAHIRLERNGPRGASESPSRPRRLGPIAKLRRARYVMSRLNELKPGRENPTR
jgi:hypothetical protein